jgi:1,4-dihydroxy-2-naphthoate octaprenyltransferase
MTVHTCRLFLPGINVYDLAVFITSSTLLSYNLHWFLLNDDLRKTERITWTHSHKILLLLLAFAGAACTVYLFFRIRQYWLPVMIPALITLVYTAPKVPALYKLKTFAYSKTFLLSFTWTYVTVIMPVWIYAGHWSFGHTIFCISRFSLIYPICLLFDFRDREEDLRQGLVTLPSRISTQALKIIFYTILTIFTASTLFLLNYGFQLKEVMMLLIPGIILAFLYPMATRNHSDHLYYFILDGLMMLSALMSILMAF